MIYEEGLHVWSHVIVDISYEERLTFSAACLYVSVAIEIILTVMIVYLGKDLESRTSSGHKSQNPRVAMSDDEVYSMDPIIYNDEVLITPVFVIIVCILMNMSWYRDKMFWVPSVLAVRSPTVGVKYWLKQ